MKNGPRKYAPEEKVAILRRHLVEKESVSSLCEEYQIHPTVFYRWLKVFFEKGAAAFQRQPDSTRQQEQERIAALEKKLRTKDEVLAELREEHVAVKKSLGES